MVFISKCLRRMRQAKERKSGQKQPYVIPGRCQISKGFFLYRRSSRNGSAGFTPRFTQEGGQQRRAKAATASTEHRQRGSMPSPERLAEWGVRMTFSSL